MRGGSALHMQAVGEGGSQGLAVQFANLEGETPQYTRVNNLTSASGNLESERRYRQYEDSS
jgi:hypothetical protein